MNARQQAQYDFERSGNNIIVGAIKNCPLAPQVLQATNSDSPYVIQTFLGGLTAKIYHLHIDGQDYTLKKCRPQSGVDNHDGELAFLNEVQRRADFSRLKQSGHSAELCHIIDTLYADYRLGIILSPWIEGEPLHTLNPAIATQLLDTLFACEKHGLMEWDLCAGNLLLDNTDNLMLFDFGYMYPFDPLHEYNSDGLSMPVFHAAERFETRFYFGWLLENHMSAQQQLGNYAMWKQAALTNYQQRRTWLAEHHAAAPLLQRIDTLIILWQNALTDSLQLQQLFILEAFRSHTLDIADDISGRSCTSLTLKRIDKLFEYLQHHFPLLHQQCEISQLTQHDTQAQLLARLQHQYQLAQQYQLG